MFRLNSNFIYASHKMFNKMINNFPVIVSNIMSINTSSVAFKETAHDAAALKKENKKKNIYITLIGTDGKLSTSTIDAATKLSKRRDLKLVKVSDLDIKKQNPLYQLISTAQMLEEDIERKKQNREKKTGYKSEKIMTFSHKISEHDLKSKVHQVLKLLAKNHEVRVTISGTPENSTAESVYQNIEILLKNEGRILQKRNVDGNIKFVVIPPKKVNSKKEVNVQEENTSYKKDIK